MDRLELQLKSPRLTLPNTVPRFKPFIWGQKGDQISSVMPTCALNRDFQVQQDIAASRSRGWAWEEQNHTLSF